MKFADLAMEASYRAAEDGKCVRYLRIDAYVAVAGLPQEQPDHALRAARMAMAMVRTMREVATRRGEPL